MRLSFLKKYWNLHANLFFNSFFPQWTLIFTEVKVSANRNGNICLSMITFPQIHDLNYTVQLSNRCSAFPPLTLCSWKWSTQQRLTEYRNISVTWCKWFAFAPCIAKWQALKQNELQCQRLYFFMSYSV